MERKAKIMAICTQKGGIGKTVAAVHLGIGLAGRANASFWLTWTQNAEKRVMPRKRKELYRAGKLRKNLGIRRKAKETAPEVNKRMKNQETQAAEGRWPQEAIRETRGSQER